MRSFPLAVFLLAVELVASSGVNAQTAMAQAPSAAKHNKETKHTSGLGKTRAWMKERYAKINLAYTESTLPDGEKRSAGKPPNGLLTLGMNGPDANLTEADLDLQLKGVDDNVAKAMIGLIQQFVFDTSEKNQKGINAWISSKLSTKEKLFNEAKTFGDRKVRLIIANGNMVNVSIEAL